MSVTILKQAKRTLRIYRWGQGELGDRMQLERDSGEGPGG